MSTEQNQKALLALLRRGLGTSGEPVPENVDYTLLSLEAKEQAMEAVILTGVDDTVPVSDEIKAQWLRNSAMRMAKANMVNAEQVVLLQALTAARISYVLLKGSSAAMYYPNPSLRAMGDIDILIPNEQFTQANDLLLSSGYDKLDEETADSVDVAYRKNGIDVELHHKVGRFPTPELQKTVDDIFEPVFETAVERTCCDRTFRCSAPALQGLVLVLHAQKHLSGMALGLRQVCDFAMFCASDDMKKGGEQLREYCARLGLTTFLKVMTKTAVVYLGVEKSGLTWCMDAEDAACDVLIRYCFENGNLGHKNDGDESLSGTVANSGKGQIERAFRNIIIGAQNSMPIMRKCPPLVIFAPFCMGIRYLYRVHTGKRKTFRFKKAVARSIKRNQLERSLKVFEK